jgi:hypothetical protein
MLGRASWARVVEVVAEEGDAVLAHPLVFHVSDPDQGSQPRVMTRIQHDRAVTCGRKRSSSHSSVPTVPVM